MLGHVQDLLGNRGAIPKLGCLHELSHVCRGSFASILSCLPHVRLGGNLGNGLAWSASGSSTRSGNVGASPPATTNSQPTTSPSANWQLSASGYAFM